MSKTFDCEHLTDGVCDRTHLCGLVSNESASSRPSKWCRSSGSSATVPA